MLKNSITFNQTFTDLWPQKTAHSQSQVEKSKYSSRKEKQQNVMLKTESHSTTLSLICGHKKTAHSLCTQQALIVKHLQCLHRQVVTLRAFTAVRSAWGSHLRLSSTVVPRYLAELTVARAVPWQKMVLWDWLGFGPRGWRNIIWVFEPLRSSPISSSHADTAETALDIWLDTTPMYVLMWIVQKDVTGELLMYHSLWNCSVKRTNVKYKQERPKYALLGYATCAVNLWCLSLTNYSLRAVWQVTGKPFQQWAMDPFWEKFINHPGMAKPIIGYQ